MIFKTKTAFRPRIIRVVAAIAILVALVLPLCASAHYATIDDYNVLTKKTFSNVSYRVYQLKGDQFELTDAEKEERKSTAMSIVSGIVEYNEYGDNRNTASNYFNCHNYAWQTGANKRLYWLNDGYINTSNPQDVAVWIKDPHTHQITTPVAGCIVVYIRNNTAVHSGIVVSVSNGVPTLIRSKWGNSCIFLHALSGVPGGYKEPNGTVNVKYYTVDTSHTQTNVYGVNNNQHHKGGCSVCERTGLSFSHHFTYTPAATPSAGHNKYCADCGETYVEGHTFNQVGVWYTCRYCGYKTKNPGGQVSKGD
ncbi:MAG: hypothetical protein J5793_03860 [Clostridia bacterium]|nr:hypothetical protein [Clostridia bacterium]